MMFFRLVTAVDLSDKLFDRLLSLRCRNVLFRDPPVCFFTVLEIVFLSACFGDFYGLLRQVALEHSVSTVPFQYVWQSIE